MEVTSIQNGLDKFVERLDSQTFKRTYKVLKSRASLLNDGMGTRANAIWKMAEYIVAPYDNDAGSPLDEYLKGWKELTKSYKNQFLIIGTNATDWMMYDSDGNCMGGNDYIEDYLKSKNTKADTSSDVNIKTLTSYVMALRTKPFLLLAGISGTGKSRIVREFAFKSCPTELQDKDGTTPGNYCMVEVKPNWHDSTELLGYWSNLQEKYIFTRFVKFLVKAKMYPKVPFFVCLDEMNLAPVEQYFAEFLSVIETRKNVSGEIKSGALVDKEYFRRYVKILKLKNNETGDPTDSLKTDKDIYKGLFELVEKDCQGVDILAGSKETLITEGLTLPENVFIIGTVNMDDTTNQFSRKVIDRAMTIEMNGGALEDIFNEEDGLCYSARPILMNSLRSNYVTAKEVIEKCPAVSSDEQIRNFIQGKDGKGLPQRLQEINTVLDGTPFKVSYRVMNELTIYLGVLFDAAIEDGKKVNHETFMPYVQTAIDKMLLMKILPRVEGDDEMFRISDKERAANGLDSQVNEEGGTSYEFTKLDWLKQIAPKHNEDNKEEYMAVDKLSEMIDRLNRQSFTRYWP